MSSPLGSLVGGRVVDDNLVCLYHGMTFGANVMCTRIPTQHIPGTACVQNEWENAPLVTLEGDTIVYRQEFPASTLGPLFCAGLKFEDGKVVQSEQEGRMPSLAVSLVTITPSHNAWHVKQELSFLLVETLITATTDIDLPDGRFTPLALAAVQGDLSMVNLLLMHGADPNAPSLNGANSLSMAVRSCRASLELISRLIASGADLENRSGVGITPLMFAVQEEQTELALMLIEAGAQINTLNPFGEGILNYAIYTQNTTMIVKALERGVNTQQLSKLFTTVDYDPPGIGEAQAHHNVLCN